MGSWPSAEVNRSPRTIALPSLETEAEFRATGEASSSDGTLDETDEIDEWPGNQPEISEESNDESENYSPETLMKNWETITSEILAKVFFSVENENDVQNLNLIRKKNLE